MDRSTRASRFMLVLSLAILACSLPYRIEIVPTNPTVTPATPSPPPPGTALPVEGRPSQTPLLLSSTPSNTPLPVEASATAEFMNTVVPGGFEPAGPDLPVIHISQPGPASSVASPVEVSGISEPTQEQWIMIEVTDETGGVLAEEGTFIDAGLGASGPFQASLSFSVDRDQPGRISVYDVSARDGGLSHLTSVPVMLLSSGGANITSSPDPSEAIFIRIPTDGADVGGGRLELEGLSAPYLEGDLQVTLCGEGEAGGAPHRICGTVNNIIAEGKATRDSAEPGEYASFSSTLAYGVSSQTRARLVLYAVSPRDHGFEHVSSVSILLNP